MVHMDSTINALSRAMDYGSTLVQALDNNLSNINTPGYKRKDVSFAAALDDADDALQTATLKKTDPRHLDADDTNPSASTIFTDTSGSMRADGNNVDIDAESTRLAAAEIFYDGAAQLTQSHFAGLKYVISGG
jgi:flagellar basal-body rod protein FlgB